MGANHQREIEFYADWKADYGYITNLEKLI
jgi:hypothetical protein